MDEEECTPSLISPTFEEDEVRQHNNDDDEVAGSRGGSGGCDSEGGCNSDVCGSFWADTMEETLFECSSLAESLQAHWH